MNDETVSRETDPIDEAIAATEAAKEGVPTQIVAVFAFMNGERMKIEAPIVFDSDMFESAVGVLMQMRLASDQRLQAEEAKLHPIVVPEKPHLLGPDGGRI